jgi:hypothetical protein
MIHRQRAQIKNSRMRCGLTLMPNWGLHPRPAFSLASNLYDTTAVYVGWDLISLHIHVSHLHVCIIIILLFIIHKTGFEWSNLVFCWLALGSYISSFLSHGKGLQSFNSNHAFRVGRQRRHVYSKSESYTITTGIYDITPKRGSQTTNQQATLHQPRG